MSKYRPAKKGGVTVGEPTPGGKPKSGREDEADNGRRRRGGAGGRAGGVYALFVDEEGEPGEEVRADNDPVPQWITLAEGTRTPDQLEDRAAKYLRPPTSVTTPIKIEREIAYGIPGPHPKPFRVEELDHLIPLELGGAPKAIANLWPEAAAGTWAITARTGWRTA